ncbi:hypothetical protein ACN6AT_39340 (plasmid) [Streptomyces sp. JL4002]|uniref:hypothetical protein n=1 Tax=Streptomyces sp. JL4002 TaxID=3404781 RepID=UPI003B2818C8
MREAVLYAVLWAATGWLVWRCWGLWRIGSDRLWPARWGALAWALLILALAAGMSLRLFGASPTTSDSVTLVLALAAAASALARLVATRRADTATRAMRSELGLPAERALWRPAAVGTLWGIGIFVLCLTGAFTAAAAGWQMDTTDASGVLRAFLGVMALAFAHVAVQHVRVHREEHRVRKAEHDYLARTAPEPDLPR